MKELFYLQDHFGINPSLLFQGRPKFHMLFFQIFSLFINLVCLLLLIVFFVELFSHNKPSTNHFSLFNALGSNITLNSDDLIIAFGVLDSQFTVIKEDKSLFTLEANYEIQSHIDDSFHMGVFPMNPIPCNEINGKEYLKHGYINEYNINNLAQYKCYNTTTEGESVVIGGNFGTSFYGVISVHVRTCVNDSENISSESVVCKSQSEIENILKGSWFEVFFLDHYIDIYNHSHPVQTFSNSFFTQIDSAFSKSLIASFSSLRVVSDNGIIFDTSKHVFSHKFQSLSYDMRSAGYHQGSLIELAVVSSKSEEKFVRSYIKIQEICANIGGLITGFQIVGIVLFKIIQMKIYENKLVNILFVCINKNSMETTSSNKMCNEDKGKVNSIHIVHKNKAFYESVNKNHSFEKLTSGVGNNNNNEGNANNNNSNKTSGVKIKEIQTFKQKRLFNFNIRELICLRCSKKNYGIWVDIQKEYEEILKVLRKKMDLCMMILLQNEVNHIKQLVIPNKMDLYQPGLLKFSWYMGPNNHSNRNNQKLSNSLLKHSLPNLQTIK